MGDFQGFGAETFGFLEELEQNNERPWFNEHKHRYEATVLEPALDFIAAMNARLPAISDHFVAIPKRTGGSLMRVYRDTRFSKDKTPYKTNIGMQFRHERGKDVHAPGFYVHIQRESCFLAAGMWHPARDALEAIRTAIVEHPAKWKRVRDNRRFRGVFDLGGASLKRPPRGYAPDHPYLEDLKRKDHIAMCYIDRSEAAAPAFADAVGERFAASGAYMGFLCDALGLEH